MNYEIDMFHNVYEDDYSLLLNRSKKIFFFRDVVNIFSDVS